MIWEYRSYDVAHGRLGEEVERMHRVAFAASEGGGSMFDAYRVPRPFAAWSAIAGDKLPSFGYLVAWDSLAARQQAFPRFWADPRWIDIKETTDDGRPMVQRIDCWIVQPTNGRQPRARASASPCAVQELRWIKLANGNLAAARVALDETIVQPLERAGAETLSMFDLVIGPKMASLLLFTEWPSLEACEQGNTAAATRQRTDLVQILSHSVIQPVDVAKAGERAAA